MNLLAEFALRRIKKIEQLLVDGNEMEALRGAVEIRVYLAQKLNGELVEEDAH